MLVGEVAGDGDLPFGLLLGALKLLGGR